MPLMTRDEYHHSICEIISTKSHCLSRKVGAIIVRDNRILSTGYNGPPVGFRHCSTVSPDRGVCPRKVAGYSSGDGLHMCPATHAEANCIATAARMGVGVDGATMYMNSVVACKNCFGLILNAGLRELVVESLDTYDKMTVDIMKASISRVRVRIFSHL